MTAWLAAAAVLLATLAPLAWVALRRAPEDGLVALEVAGNGTSLALLAIAAGLRRDALSDVALVLVTVGAIGSLAYSALLEREP